MRTLRGRIGLALLVFGLATLLAVGGALWFALRDLHRDAAIGALTELTVPYAIARPRQRSPAACCARRRQGQLIAIRASGSAGNPERQRAGASQRPLPGTVRGGHRPERSSRSSSSQGTTALIVTPVEGPADAARGRRPTSKPTWSVDRLPPARPRSRASAQVLYAATPIQEATASASLPLIVLARADESAELATAGPGPRAGSRRGSPCSIIGIPIAAGLSRSVTGRCVALRWPPETVAAGEVPEPLPTTGPRRGRRGQRRLQRHGGRGRTRRGRPSASCWPTSATTCVHP